MKQRNNCSITESGVSELIGAIVLIAMIVLVVAVVAAFLTNRPASNEIPEIRFSVINASPYNPVGVYSINLTHTGGDDLNPGDYSFFINDGSLPVSVNNITPNPLTNSWSVGKTVMVNSSVVPDYIRVYYYNTTKVNNPALLGQRTIGTIPPTSTTIPTASPTATTTTITTVITTIPTTTPTPCQPPVAGFTSSQAASPPLTINFVSTSTGTGTMSYLWKFGDNSTSSTGPTVTHTYPSSGSYLVNLTVTDSCNSNSSQKQVPVICPAVIADFKADSQQFCGGPYNVQFTDNSTGTGLTYLWNFGDSTTSPDKNPSHLYTSAGVYTVSLTVRNTCGNSNTKIMNDFIVAASESYNKNLEPLLSSKNGCLFNLGYKNENSNPVCIPVGPQNKFTSQPFDMGQPEIFYPGIHNNVFSVSMPANTKTKWHLTPSHDLDIEC
jgi:PKD repeat protein